MGNLKYRENYSALEGHEGQNDLRESFCYDGLGNITYKRGVGYYAYGTNAGPHAVTGISDTANSGSDHTAYTYDGNGNMVSGDGRTLTYSTFDKPIEIGKNGHKTAFRYGPSRGRYLRVDTASNGVSTTTRYLGNVERIHEQGSGTITWRRTVAGAVYHVKTDLDHNVQSTEKAFIYQDHLGSTDVITDIEGTVIQAQSFDAWGHRRQADTWAQLSPLELLGFDTSITHKGYTGHEQLDEVGLIHMNGRVYDPKLARFLQADPFIQAASNTQSYNRYSYLVNNPLNATDPSGFVLKKLWDGLRPVVGVIVAVVGIYLCSGNVACGEAAYLWIGGMSGAATAGANGGSLGDIFIGAVVGAFSGGAAATGNAFIMGVSGFITAGFTGADPAAGFAAAGIGALVGGLGLEGWAGFAAAATAGGVASEITGGKFANGAATAAFMWALKAGVESAKGSTQHDFKTEGKLGPDRFSAEEQKKIRKEIALAMDGAADGFDSEGAGLEYAYENIFSIADKYDIEISFNYRPVDGKWQLSHATTSFYNHQTLRRDVHTHQTSNFWSPPDMSIGKAVNRNTYLMNDTGIYRFRGGDWRADWFAAKAAGQPLPSSDDYHAKYGWGGKWAKVHIR